ncbi:hypothetical protein MHYP_G00043820 [Metynnis hypsauchen]
MPRRKQEQPKRLPSPMLAVSEAIASRQGTTHRAVAIQKVSLALAPQKGCAASSARASRSLSSPLPASRARRAAGGSADSRGLDKEEG